MLSLRPTTSRSAQQEALSLAVDALAQGHGGLVVLTGEAGSGKTHLLHQVLDVATAVGELRSVWVSASRPSDGDGTPGLWVEFAHALRRMDRDADVAGLLSCLDTARRQEWTRAHLARAADHIVAQARRPLLLVVDDAHSTDERSAELLDRVLAVMQDVPLLLVLVGRPDPAGPLRLSALADGLRGRSGVTHVRLGPMPPEELLALFGSANQDADAAARAVRASGGSPLLLRLFAQLGQSADAWGSVGPTARMLLVERVRSVDELGAVAVLALLGRPATVSLLAQATGYGHGALELALAGAQSAGVVERTGRIGQYHIVYPVLREAVIACLEPDQVQQIHLKIVGAMRGDGGSASWHRAECARHVVASGVGGDVAARSCLEAALWEEEVHALDEAEEFATYGLDSGGSDPLVRVQLMRVLGRAHGRAGRVEAALDLLDRAVAVAASELAPLEYAEAVSDLAGVDLAFVATPAERIGHLETALSIVEAELADLPGEDARIDRAGRGPRLVALRALLLSYLAVALYYADLDRSRTLADLSIEVALDSGDPQAIAVAFDAWVFAAAGTESLARMERLAQRSRTRAGTALSGSWCGVVGPALIRGDRVAVDVGLARLAHQRTVLPSARGRGLVLVGRLSRAVLDGDVDAVPGLFEEIQACRSADVAALAAVMELLWHVVSGQLRGQSADALSAALPTPSLSRLFLTGSVVAGLLTGDEYAQEGLRGLLPWREQLLDPRPDLAADISNALLAVVGGALRDEEMCTTAIERLHPYADKFTIVSSVVCVGPVGWFLSWAYEGLGDLTAALDAVTRAEAAAGRMRSPVWTVMCLTQRAHLLARSRHPKAAEVRSAAVAQAVAAGLSNLVRRAQEVIVEQPAASAIERGGRHLQLLQLAAEGMTNEQIARTLFLSVSTVERQFTQLYRSLGVRNRAEAVAMLRANVLDPRGAQAAQAAQDQSA